MNEHPELFRIDRRVAFASCWVEFFDLLQKIFCLNARTLNYYRVYDLPNVPLISEMKHIKELKFLSLEDTPVTLKFNEKLISKFMKMEQLPCFFKLLECVNLFGEEGGFEATLEVSTYPAHQNVEFLIQLVQCFSVVKSLLHRSFVMKLGRHFSKALIATL